MKITFDQFNPTTVEVINRQQKVEYEVISGKASEQEIRAALMAFTVIESLQYKSNQQG